MLGLGAKAILRTRGKIAGSIARRAPESVMAGEGPPSADLLSLAPQAVGDLSAVSVGLGCSALTMHRQGVPNSDPVIPPRALDAAADGCPDAAGAMRVTAVRVPVDAIQSLDMVAAAMSQAIAQARPWLMTFANPATSVAAKRRPELCEMLQRFDMVAPDGIGMTVAMRALHGQPAMRISFDGTSLAPIVFRLAVDRRLSVVLVGGDPGIAQAARDKIVHAYPGIDVIGTFDGYGDMTATVAAVRALAPSIVIAGMGVLVQERLLLKLVEQEWVGLGFTCGGYLDQLSAKGTDYYPMWIDNYDLRWAYRLVKEPRRLWRRYLVEYPEFGFELAKTLIRSGRG
jgi:N-acetylglucosaminyldiphosphoundecaprenol N-acetyl-beta-D-mannosaminyltransferase